MSATFTGHPREPETFEFTERTEREGRPLRIIKSHVIYDARWPLWRRVTVGALHRALARLARTAPC